MNQLVKDKFKAAIESNDIPLVEEMLARDESLAHVDLRPVHAQEKHGYEFPLNIASKAGRYKICELLLNSGADPNAATKSADPAEFGIPICNAIINEDHRLANLLLDAGADPNAYPYCSRPMFETLYNQARRNGVKKEILKYGFSSYLKEDPSIGKYDSSKSSIKTLVSVLEKGVIPNISSIVRDEYMELIENLLEKCPNEKSPPLSYPEGSIFEGIVYCSSWYGYPKILKLAMEKCPDLFSIDVAKWSIYRGIISHNRDGSIKEYIEMFKFLLSYLNENKALDQLSTKSNLNPFYLIAEHFCWPNNYGYKAKISTPEDIVRVTQLFLDFGYSNYNETHQESKMTPIQKARERSNHRGMNEFIALISKLDS